MSTRWTDEQDGAETLLRRNRHDRTTSVTDSSTGGGETGTEVGLVRDQDDPLPLRPYKETEEVGRRGWTEGRRKYSRHRVS